VNIVVVDDERFLANTITRHLELAGHCARAAYCGSEGLRIAAEANADLVLCDMRLPDGNGLDLIPRFIQQRPGTKIVMMTGAHGTATAIQAMKLGAEDYLEKPFELEGLLVLVQKLDERRENELTLETVKKSGTLKTLSKLRVYMGTGMKQVYDDLTLAAAQDTVPVLLQGETGSGKEHAAWLLHQLSRRFAGPFVELNCACIPESLVEAELFGSEAGSFTDSKRRHLGHFESAQGGTLFLDEIGDLSMSAQAKLLKVLDERELRRIGSSEPVKLDIRLVAATNKDLKAESNAGRFRSDLYFRLNTFLVRIPPLRERRADIPDLARFLFAQACRNFKRRLEPLSEAQLADLSARNWEGNVRELRNLIEGSILRAAGNHVDLDPDRSNPSPCLARQAPSFPSLKEAVEDAVRTVKREMLQQALLRTKGNRSEAARVLQVDYKTISNLIKSLQIAA
jgi:DNA-binding NtrC family response regulator